jgi:hypothetical protein
LLRLARRLDLSMHVLAHEAFGIDDRTIHTGGVALIPGHSSGSATGPGLMSNCCAA